MAINIPASQHLATPVSSFYKGRALRMAQRKDELGQELLEQQVEKAKLEVDLLNNPPAADPGDEAKILKDILEIGREHEVRLASEYKTRIDRGEDEATVQAEVNRKYHAAQQDLAKRFRGYYTPDLDADYDFDIGVSKIKKADDFLKGLAPKEVKPRPHRTIKRGEKEILQEFYEETREWKDTETAPRSVRQQIETGPPGAFDLSNSDRSKLAVQFGDRLTNVLNSRETVNTLVKRIQDNPTAISTPGGFSSFLNEAVHAVKGIAANLGTAVTDEDVKDFVGKNWDFGAFQRVAVANSEIRSMLVELAYAQAKVNDPQGRVTDKDFQAMLATLGQSADPKVFTNTLRSVSDRGISRFKTWAKVNKMDSDERMKLLDEQQTEGDLTPEEMKELEELRKQQRGK